MGKNYVKIAFRNLSRNRGYAAINIVGPTVGTAVCFVIALFI